MRKITLLLSFIACVIVAQGQNLLVNPSFETWEAGTPTGWTTLTAANAVISENTTLKTEGDKSFKAVVGTINTYSIFQVVPVTVGKTYTLSVSYYIESGDATDARLWCNFKNGTAYLSDTDLTTAGILEKLKGPGGTSSYFADEKGAWKTFTTEFVAPAGVTDFNFEIRTYKTATVNWDNLFFGEKTTSTSNPKATSFNAYVNGKSLELKNVANGSTVEIFNALGAKLQSSVLVNGSVELNNTSKGLYVVRVGKNTQKFMVK